MWGQVYQPWSNPQSGQFLGLFEPIGFLVVRGDEEKHFLNYIYCTGNSKILYSNHKRRIPHSFSGTFLNRHML